MKTLFIAHRGGGEGVRENRIESIKANLERDYIDGIEIDVRATQDDVLIVHHDRGVYINGKRVWTENVTYDDIKYLGIPTLGEVIDLVAPTNKILNVDIKDENCIEPLKTLLKTKSLKKRLYFDCFDVNLLLRLQEDLPDGQYFYSLAPKDSRDFTRRFVVRIFLLTIAIFLSQLIVYFLRKRIKRIKIAGIIIHYKFATKSFIADLKSFGYKVAVWGTDDYKDLKKFFDAGVDAIKTKNLRAIKQLNKTN